MQAASTVLKTSSAAWAASVTTVLPTAPGTLTVTSVAMARMWAQCSFGANETGASATVVAGGTSVIVRAHLTTWDAPVLP